MDKNKIYYLDNIKIILSFLVVLFHTNSAFGGLGGWYTIEESNEFISSSILTLINVLCQSFFMGFYFFISGFLTPNSYNNKRSSVFLVSKIKRLLIPACFYFFVINPICINFVKSTPYFESLGFYNLWFTVALFYFNFFYFIGRKIVNSKNIQLSFPNKKNILSYIILLGLCNFLVRMVFSVDNMYFSDFTLGYFPQYITLFIIGIVAFKNNWLNQIETSTVKYFFRISIIAMISLPIVFVGEMLFVDKIERFYGGFYLESFFYSIWEPFVFVGIIMKIIYMFQKKYDVSNSKTKVFARCSYGVYILQAPIILVLQRSFRIFEVNNLIKSTVIIIITYFMSTMIVSLILKIKIVRQII
jgi:surface polysaccharide O-acyltransferase-like enzyme